MNSEQGVCHPLECPDKFCTCTPDVVLELLCVTNFQFWRPEIKTLFPLISVGGLGLWKKREMKLIVSSSSHFDTSQNY